ncbi:MAG TPA: Asp-tRNA(Asn)/Glu-tRNA(Gln) amidotransferase subunit GatB [Anaerolineae bacterium]|nr:Asp-tRNA(Asn)/Glu-tRNA(Gln) amidotransferase subunit GatB [Anaerolineae bacterium]HQH39350.1 Asp-tRNA(Asn)/Glu-tRNA(Gln) amidotransferase subunit GatB [Anaerolineae bacterium]
MEYEAVIGLEVHAQVHTRSKMYCACPVVADTGDVPPNTQVCPVCLALPGALPVVNRRVVELGIMTGLALGCTINPVNVFARKSYFYPDLPKGYQISQYELPLAVNGVLEIETEAGIQRIGITRAHLEEDTAKLYHQDDGSALVDFNRAGVPLIEIVSAPDLHTVEAVQAYATTLRDMLVYLGVNAGDMEKGEMRFEANVSLHPAGATMLGTRTEIKNLNSFRALAASVAYEIARQKAVLAGGGTVVQQTLGWDETAGKTYSQRSKEEAHDYRYFPEPDIPPLEIAPEWVEALGARVPELPPAKKRRLMAEYGIRPYDAALLVSDRRVADYFEAAAHLGRAHNVAPQDVANWVSGELFRILNATGIPIEACKTTPAHLAALLALVQQGEVSVTAAKTALGAMCETGDAPEDVIRHLGLTQISNADALAALVNAALDAHPAQVQQYLDGKTNILGWLVGQVMRASEGKANPQDTRSLLQQALERRRSI